MNSDPPLQGAHAAGGVLAPPVVDPRVSAFEMEYARWVEDQEKQAAELRAALQPGAPEFQLRFLVDAALAHYGALFEARSRAARADAFFVLSGVWRAPAERFFLWIGGFRPSELLKVLAPQLDPLAEPQASAVRALQNTARQLEDALSQGMNKLQQTLVDALMTVDAPGDAGGGYAARQMASAVGKLDDLVSFVDQVTTSPRTKTSARSSARPSLLSDLCCVHGAGGPPPAADAAEHEQDPDGAAGGAGAPGARRLLPAAARAQLALGGAPAGAGVTPGDGEWLDGEEEVALARARARVIGLAGDRSTGPAGEARGQDGRRQRLGSSSSASVRARQAMRLL